jgi:hypothetical protein
MHRAMNPMAALIPPATSMGIRGSLPLHRAETSGRASGARGPCEGGVRHRRGRR